MTAPSASGHSFPRHRAEEDFDTSCGLPPLHGDSYADIVERLFDEYHTVLSLHEIAEVVAGCRRDLAGTPKGAMAELIERLARQRIAERL